jgi:serine/threonine protein kinase
LPHEKATNAVTVIKYGGPAARFFLWQKVLLLLPLWAIPLVPLIGIICHIGGNLFTKIGYALLLGLFAGKFFEDLLKLKLRLDDDYLYFGFQAIPIQDIARIEVDYKKHKCLPGSLSLIRASGKKPVRLSLNGLSFEDVDRLLKHLQSRNSKLESAAILNTLLKCRKAKRQALQVSGRLELPYQTRQLVEESVETYKSAAQQWARVGPVAVFLLISPAWMSVLSGLYGAQFSSTFNLNSLDQVNLHQFLSSIIDGVYRLIGDITWRSATSFNALAEKPYFAAVAAASIACLAGYLGRLYWKPNILIVDDKKATLKLGLWDRSLPMDSIAWSDVSSVSMRTGATGNRQLRLSRKKGKDMQLDLDAIVPEDRAQLLKFIERNCPDCNLEYDLTQSMLPKSQHSYTEIWLQSLNQPPERKSLDPLEPGQLTGDNRYEVIKSLGIGGQGIAYVCRQLDRKSTETVVLKETLLPIFKSTAVRRKALERFEQEARLLKSLSHSGIVSLIDFFVEDHRTYLVLQHIDGCNLRELIARDGPLNEARALALALQMCDILAYLHEHSIIHRDFTPENLILDKNGKLTLIDFNVAQQLNDGSTTTIVGKHNYLPPEQFRGKATAQSDLFAFGATLYFLLCGCDPEAISQSSLAGKRPDIGTQLNEIVERATELNLSQRYSSAAQIKADLIALSDCTASSDRIFLERETEIYG